jgi:hypothetical protein
MALAVCIVRHLQAEFLLGDTYLKITHNLLFRVMMMKIDGLYKLTFDDLKKGSEILGDAFIDYPTFKYLFPDLYERKRKIKHVMRFFLKCGIIHGEVYAPSKDMEGISIWYKSGNLNFNLRRLLKGGLIDLLYNLNITSFNRFKKLGDAKRLNRNKLMIDNYYFLDLIGINPVCERKGYAQLLIESMLEQIDKEQMSCLLETSNIKNTDYYKRYGFSIINEYNYNGLLSFLMLRKGKNKI